MRAENTRLTVENAQLRAQIENSDDIQAQQSFLAPRALEAVFAQVIGRSPLPDHETVLLDRGSSDGVIKGTPIVVGEGIYIGRILSVAAHTSVALLAVDSDHHVAAIVQNDARSPGELQGERGLGMRLDLIPRNDAIQVGETIVTSGLDPLIPEGLVLGHIARDTTKTGDLFQSVDVEQAAIPSRLRIVAILLTPQL
jgi:rod shape-determining protein MreC